MRWIFGDQLGPHFVEDADQVVLVESSAVWERRVYHRAKAQIMLSAIRHRARELGDRVRYSRVRTYREALSGIGPITVSEPTSYGARRLVRDLGATVEPARGFVTSADEFTAWADARGRKRLLQEDFYRHVRTRHDILMQGGRPAGGQWNFDHDNRLPPPRKQRTLGLPPPWAPVEDDIDAEVRRDIDEMEARGIRFVGGHTPRRFAVTRAEALDALDDFVGHRLAAFGPYEDAAMDGDPFLAHSLLSVPLNLGLLHPLEIVSAAIAAWEEGAAPLQSVEGLVRQVIGWREYVWHLHWHLGEGYVGSNALDAHKPLPTWWESLDADSVHARCLQTSLAELRDRGWNHHIQRLMIFGNWALQRGFDPRATSDWFRRVYVDGYEWVMSANVIGMALYADGGVMATKPYAAGGAYINRMTDYCRGCAYKPAVRVGPTACPFTAGYWAFIDRARPHIADNHRMSVPLRGLDRLSDRDAVIAQEDLRGDGPP